MSGYKEYANMHALQLALAEKQLRSAARYALRLWYVYANVKAQEVTPNLALVEYKDSKAFVARASALLDANILKSVFNALRAYESTSIEGKKYFRIAPYTITFNLFKKAPSTLELAAVEEWTVAHSGHDATGHCTVASAARQVAYSAPGKPDRGQKLKKPRKSAKAKRL